MKIKREDLLSVLRRVVPVIRPRTTVPAFSTVKIEALNGRLHAMATDCDRFVEAICLCEGNLMPCCVAPGPLLALSSYGPDTMDLNLEKMRLSVVCGSRTSLSVTDPAEFPQFPKDKLVSLGVNCEDLATAIESSAWATTTKGYDLPKQSIMVILESKAIKAAAMDGHRMAYYSKASIASDATLFINGTHAPLLVEALRGEKAKVSTNSEGWLVVWSSELWVAVNQVPLFNLPIKEILKCQKSATDLGVFSRDLVSRELETMQTIGANSFGYVYGKATFNGALSLDYENSINEFHSVVSADASAKQHESQRGGDEVSRKPNVSAGAKPLPDAPMTAPNPTMTVSFDAALLHNILRHLPTEQVKMSTDNMALLFESGDLLAALALVKTNP